MRYQTFVLPEIFVYIKKEKTSITINKDFTFFFFLY